MWKHRNEIQLLAPRRLCTVDSSGIKHKKKIIINKFAGWREAKEKQSEVDRWNNIEGNGNRSVRVYSIWEKEERLCARQEAIVNMKTTSARTAKCIQTQESAHVAEEDDVEGECSTKTI